MGAKISNAAVEISDGSIKALYHLEDTVDSSGNGYNLTNNSSVTFTSAKLTNGASTTGSNYLSVNSDVGIAGGTISMGGWFRTASNPSTARRAIVEQYDDGVDVMYHVTLQNNIWAGPTSVVFGRSKAGVGDSYVIHCVFTPTPGTWYHVYGMHNSVTGLAEIWKDGVLCASGSGTGNGSHVSSDRTEVGAMEGGNQKWVGQLDEVFIGNVIYSSTTRASLYNSGAGAEICVSAGCGGGGGGSGPVGTSTASLGDVLAPLNVVDLIVDIFSFLSLVGLGIYWKKHAYAH